MSPRIIASLSSLLPAMLAACASADTPVEAGDAGSVGSTTPAYDPDDQDDGSSSGDPEPGSSSGDADAPPGDPDALDAYILGLGQLAIDPIADEHPIACPGVCAMWQEGEQTCTEGYLAQTVHFDSGVAERSHRRLRRRFSDFVAHNDVRRGVNQGANEVGLRADHHG